MWTKLLKALAFWVIASPLWAISNPIMIIRCGTPSAAPARLVNSGPCGSNSGGCGDGYICVNGTCVEVCSFVSPECKSDCDDAGGTLSWNSSQGACECWVEGNEGPEFMCCPTFLSMPQDDFDLNVAQGINLGESYCYIPNTGDCYDGRLTVQVPPLLCNSTKGDSVEVTVILLVENGACVTIADLQNCELTNGQNFLLLLAEELGNDTYAAFCDDDGDGTIELIFKRDPAAETILDFGALGQTVIPACPAQSLDPCTCNDPMNIYNPDGTIQFFHDVLAIIGASPNTSVMHISGMKSSIGQVLAADLGSTDDDGNFMYSFYRDPLSTVVITYYVPVPGDDDDLITASFTCDLGPTSCTPIPTLGQWAVLILGLLLLITGVVVFKYGRVKTV